MADEGRRPEDAAVTTTDEPLAIRPPGWARVLGPVFLAAWLSVILVEEGFLVPVVVGALLVAAVVGRMLCTSVIGRADGWLTVRNIVSTRRFARADVLGVGVDRAGRSAGRGWALWLLLDDGSRHRLDVTEVPFLGPSSATLERQAAAIRAWLDGRPQPRSGSARDTR
jgi:hypothetical protein